MLRNEPQPSPSASPPCCAVCCGLCASYCIASKHEQALNIHSISSHFISFHLFILVSSSLRFHDERERERTRIRKHAQPYTNQILGSWFCGNNALQIIIVFLVININDVFSDLQQGFKGYIVRAPKCAVRDWDLEREKKTGHVPYYI